MASTRNFHTAGRRWLNQILNGSLARPATLSIGLRTLDGVGGHPADAADGDTLGVAGTLAEVAGSGYARQAVNFNAANFPESATGADSQLIVAQQTFNFTGNVIGITHACLIDTTNGVLIASAPLAATRNVANGDSIKETFVFTMTGG